jgi:hypothetical protein
MVQKEPQKGEMNFTNRIAMTVSRKTQIPAEPVQGERQDGRID